MIPVSRKRVQMDMKAGFTYSKNKHLSSRCKPVRKGPNSTYQPTAFIYD